jgi:tetratricopeptide (TPR) repeat protein
MAEDRRDAALHREIRQLVADKTRQRILAQALLAAFQQDVRWYGRLEATLRAWWEDGADEAVPERYGGELGDQLRLLAARRANREACVRTMVALLRALPSSQPAAADAHAQQRRTAFLPLASAALRQALAALLRLVARYPQRAVIAATIGALAWLSAGYGRRPEQLFPVAPPDAVVDVPDASPLVGVMRLQGQRGREPVPDASRRATVVLPALVEADRELAEQFNAQALGLMRQGDWAGACSLNAQALEADPTFYKAPNDLGFCLYALGWTDRAIEQWRIAVVIKPDNADAHAALGVALHARGDMLEGLRWYRRALHLEPRYGEPGWLQQDAAWSAEIVADGEPLRAALAP